MLSITGPGREGVRSRAGGVCEYCRLPEIPMAAGAPFEVEHIMPRSRHPGTRVAANDPSNLAWACRRCNLHKRDHTEGVDPLTGGRDRLLNPREDAWENHFKALPSGTIIGLSAIGRVTVAVLKFNDDPHAVKGRALLWEVRWWPAR